jgi:hypothetical protein
MSIVNEENQGYVYCYDDNHTYTCKLNNMLEVKFLLDCNMSDDKCKSRKNDIDNGVSFINDTGSISILSIENDSSKYKAYFQFGTKQIEATFDYTYIPFSENLPVLYGIKEDQTEQEMLSSIQNVLMGYNIKHIQGINELEKARVFQLSRNIKLIAFGDWESFEFRVESNIITFQKKQDDDPLLIDVEDLPAENTTYIWFHKVKDCNIVNYVCGEFKNNLIVLFFDKDVKISQMYDMNEWNEEYKRGSQEAKKRRQNVEKQIKKMAQIYTNNMIKNDTALYTVIKDYVLHEDNPQQFNPWILIILFVVLAVIVLYSDVDKNAE